MDPIHPWLDADEVRQLAESLLPPTPPPTQSSQDMGFSEGFVGFAEKKEPAPSPQPASPFEPGNPPASPLSFDQQCLRIQTLMTQTGTADSFFLLTPDGSVVFGHSYYSNLHSLAAKLAANAKKQEPKSGHIYLQVGPEQVLEILPFRMMNTQWAAGTVTDIPFSAEEVTRWKQIFGSLVRN